MRVRDEDESWIPVEAPPLMDAESWLATLVMKRLFHKPSQREVFGMERMMGDPVPVDT